MAVALRTPMVTQVLRLLPASLLAALDGWSSRVARRRAQARRMAGARKTSPLPPVVSGWPAPPHPWRD